MSDEEGLCVVIEHIPMIVCRQALSVSRHIQVELDLQV
jgi:hypothetical protein